jgi:FixJ family two-component response regulator
MAFASGGKAALEEMSRLSVDVIVSDMRMPGMDGAELLKRVKEAHPQTARIILSGHADREAIARVIRVAHQFLAKPADANTVRTVIERTCNYLTLMSDESIRRIVGAMDKLPSLPETYWDLIRIADDPDKGIADLAKVVETDPAMSLKVLQLVNSAYFGLAQRTDSISKAVSYLGSENLKGLLMAAHVFGEDGPHVEGLSLNDMRDEAVLTANLARQIVRDGRYADSAFAAGLVHDVGKLVLASDPSKRYSDLLRKAREMLWSSKRTCDSRSMAVVALPIVRFVRRAVIGDRSASSAQYSASRCWKTSSSTTSPTMPRASASSAPTVRFSRRKRIACS